MLLGELDKTSPLKKKYKSKTLKLIKKKPTTSVKNCIYGCIWFLLGKTRFYFSTFGTKLF